MPSGPIMFVYCSSTVLQFLLAHYQSITVITYIWLKFLFTHKKGDLEANKWPKNMKFPEYKLVV